VLVLVLTQQLKAPLVEQLQLLPFEEPAVGAGV
jgi:hypothetical protein